MPIEVRELVIRVTVEPSQSEAYSAGTLTVSAEQLERLKKEVLQACLAKLTTGHLSVRER